MDEYIRLLWSGLQRVPQLRVREIEADKSRLVSKASENSFDGGRTTGWMQSLADPTYIGMKNETGHCVHVVSDRSVAVLEPELRRGLHLMTWLSKKPVTWYWWDQPWTRNLPANTDPGPEHLNGGWAVPGVPEVHVYRREEALKVMIHETIHARLMDVKRALVAPVLVRFETALGRRLWPHLGECYTELFAELLWAVSSAKSLADVTRRWSHQLHCSEKQAGQVWARIHDSRENEETNVFAYYVLKWVLMRRPEVFLSPNHCVTRWFAWFEEARPRLEELGRMHSVSESQNVSLAMTCPT